MSRSGARSLLALAVAVSRVLAFRHWASDLTASAAVGMIVAGIIRERKQERG